MWISKVLNPAPEFGDGAEVTVELYGSCLMTELVLRGKRGVVPSTFSKCTSQP